MGLSPLYKKTTVSKHLFFETRNSFAGAKFAIIPLCKTCKNVLKK